MAAIYRRAGTRNFFARYRHPQTGCLTRVSLGTRCPTEAMVRLQARIEAERARGQAYREAVDRLLARVALSTRTLYASKDRLWSPLVGHLCVKDITPDQVLRMIRHRCSIRAAPGTVQADLAFLSAVLTEAGVPHEENVVLQLRRAEGAFLFHRGAGQAPRNINRQAAGNLCHT